MVTVHARLQQIPPDHTGTHDLEARDLRAEAATYDEAAAHLAEQVPEGWRILYLRTEDRTA